MDSSSSNEFYCEAGSNSSTSCAGEAEGGGGQKEIEYISPFSIRGQRGRVRSPGGHCLDILPPEVWFEVKLRRDVGVVFFFFIFIFFLFFFCMNGHS